MKRSNNRIILLIVGKQTKFLFVYVLVIIISFSKPYGKKKFFPTAFYQHLALEDGSLNTEMAEFLKQNNILIEAEQQRVERADRIAQFRASSIEKAIGSPKSKKKK